jgi:hypothetical protein
MGTLAQSNSAYKQNEGTQLSSAEVQALLGSPHFKLIDPYNVIRAAAKIYRTSQMNVEGWRQLQGSDFQNVFTCLLAHLNSWVSGLEVGKTPNGGYMQMRNVRLLELASGRCVRGGRRTDEHGTDLPCLEDFDLSITCAMVRGPAGRPWSFFRICHVDEVPRRDGKKMPYKPPIASKPKQVRLKDGDKDRVPFQPPTTPPAQSAMFTDGSDRPAWIDPEMSGRGGR